MLLYLAINCFSGHLFPDGKVADQDLRWSDIYIIEIGLQKTPKTLIMSICRFYLQSKVHCTHVTSGFSKKNPIVIEATPGKRCQQNSSEGHCGKTSQTVALLELRLAWWSQLLVTLVRITSTSCREHFQGRNARFWKHHSNCPRGKWNKGTQTMVAESCFD